jgi:F-type H+-transporting ATPase subunit epsilon
VPEANKDMQLRITLPNRLFWSGQVARIRAEGLEGSFCLLPRHIDYVSPLVPGIFSVLQAQGETFMALDEGVLVKTGPKVLVSVRQAILGPELESLKQRVHQEFEHLDDNEKRARTAVARLEAGFIRKFMYLER